MIKNDPKRRLEFEKCKETFHSLRNDHFWTQVNIHHYNAFPQEQLIEDIVEKLVFNQAFFPCYYKRYNKRDEFYLCRNFDAITQLMMNDLEHEMVKRNIDFTLQLDIAKFEYGQVDWFYKINYVLSKRIIANVLDISQFASDPEFTRIVVPMVSKFTLSFIIEHSKKQNNNITKIVAQNNGIKSLEGFQHLHMLTKLSTLDLRNNLISSLDGISQTSSVTELMLDGNPLCGLFDTTHAYVSDVCKKFPNLEWLDGHRVSLSLEMATLQNFIVVRDAYTISEEFVKTFFPIYDSFERDRLLQIYERKAIFTLSSLYNIDRIGGQSDAFQRIQKYTRFSRNVKVIANMTQACDKVFVGVTNIKQVFSELPKSNHDFKSFCIDVPMFDPQRMVIITVSGVFEEQAQTLNERSFMLGFTRSFVLVPSGDNSYSIANDQLFIHDPPFMAISTGIHPTSDNNLENVYKDLKPTEFEEKKTKMILFQNLTELKKEECTRMLEEHFWDFKVALATFNTMMQSNNIPNSMFDFK